MRGNTIGAAMVIQTHLSICILNAGVHKAA